MNDWILHNKIGGSLPSCQFKASRGRFHRSVISPKKKPLGGQGCSWWGPSRIYCSMYGVAIDSRDAGTNAGTKLSISHVSILPSISPCPTPLRSYPQGAAPSCQWKVPLKEGSCLFMVRLAANGPCPPFSPSPLPDMTYIFFRSSSTHGRASTGPPRTPSTPNRVVPVSAF